MKVHNKTNQLLLSTLSGKEVDDLEAAVEKTCKKAKNAVVKAAALGKAHHARCMDANAKRLSEGAGELSKCWTTPRPKVHL